MTSPNILGFRDKPETTASGATYSGQLCCDDVQITGDGNDAIATFTITARQLFDASKAEMLWTDQDVQRGIRPEVSSRVEKELSLSKGYPKNDIYIFNASSADDMTEKLLKGQRLFINPLVWNLRPGFFDAYYDQGQRKIYIYEGKIYLPDSHHRHQAIIKASQIYKTAPHEYPNFDLNKQFKVELYFLKKNDEGNYFFDKNQRTTPTSKSKAYDLTSLDDLSMLAKRVIEITPFLNGNVNRVTDRLSSKNPDVATLSTIREMLKLSVGFDHLDETEIEGFSQVASSFLKLLAEARPELQKLSVIDRKKVRQNLLTDAPVMFQAYSALISDYNSDVAKLGISEANQLWSGKLERIKSSSIYQFNSWSGDLFDIRNPLWLDLRLTKTNVKGNLSSTNNRAARSQAIKALKAVIGNESSTNNLVELIQ